MILFLITDKTPAYLRQRQSDMLRVQPQLAELANGRPTHNDTPSLVISESSPINHDNQDKLLYIGRIRARAYTVYN